MRANSTSCSQTSINPSQPTKSPSGLTGVKRKEPEQSAEPGSLSPRMEGLASSRVVRTPEKKRARHDDPPPSAPGHRVINSPPVLVATGSMSGPISPSELAMRRESLSGLLCSNISAKVELAVKISKKLPFGKTHVKPAGEAIKAAINDLLQRGADSAATAETQAAFRALELGVGQFISAIQSIDSCGKYEEARASLSGLTERIPATMAELRCRFGAVQMPGAGVRN